MKLVIDIGTTNMVFFDGKQKSSFRNPQYRFGSDIMSRMFNAIQNGQEKQTEILREAILFALVDFVNSEQKIKSKTEQESESKIAQTTKPKTEEKISSLIITANTVQLHFLTGFDVEGMATHPFTPVSFFGRFFSLEEIFGEFSAKAACFFVDGLDAKIFIPSCFDAFIGADLVCASYGVGLWQFNENLSNKKEEKLKKTKLLIDIGTNTEIILYHKEKYLVASTAAGPAFEGGKTKSELKGSELLHALSVMKTQNQIDETGYILVEKPLLCQEDLRILQLAKAAIRAAVDTLLHEMQISDKEVDEVFLSGAFGTHILAQDLSITGLLSKNLSQKISLKANAVLDGAFLYSEFLEDFSESLLIKQIENDFSQTNLIQLASHSYFSKTYIESMNF